MLKPNFLKKMVRTQGFFQVVSHISICRFHVVVLWILFYAKEVLFCRYSLLIRVPDSWSKGCEFKSQQEWRENFFLQSQLYVLTLIHCPFQSVLLHWSFCQKCRWQVTPKHAYTFDPMKSEWADYAAVQAECGNLSRNELTRNSSGNTQS